MFRVCLYYIRIYGYTHTYTQRKRRGERREGKKEPLSRRKQTKMLNVLISGRFNTVSVFSHLCTVYKHYFGSDIKMTKENICSWWTLLVPCSCDCGSWDQIPYGPMSFHLLRCQLARVNQNPPLLNPAFVLQSNLEVQRKGKCYCRVQASKSKGRKHSMTQL